MKMIEDQFKKCKYIFIQNKIIIPILLGIILTAVVISFSFGKQINLVENEITNYQQDRDILLNIKMSIDSLLTRTK